MREEDAVRPAHGHAARTTTSCSSPIAAGCSSSRCYELPDASRQAKGTPVINLIQVDQGERVTAALTLAGGQLEGYMVMATRRGTIKRTDCSQFQNLRRSGMIAIDLERG